MDTDFEDMVWNGKKITNKDSTLLCIEHYMLKLSLIIIFPPFAVWLDQHEQNYPDILKIMYCFILTALLYFPGLLYAISTVKLYN
jgi:uncharacterized membrane protein YqaE (UPF0057 family)